ncbi:hypothetical protein ABBQ32_013389 [Trebouxia sp. C0010 RCD-2024]
MQASFIRASAVGVTPMQATISGRVAPGQSSTVGGPYPHFRFSSALSGFRLPQVNNFVADSHRAQPRLVCFAVPASVPESANETAISLKPLPRAVENVADDPSLHNPLQRLHRLGPGWFGVILEYEGVLVEDTSELHSKAWQMLGDEEGKPRPFNWALKRAEGMKSEQTVQEVFCWSRNPMEVRRLTARKEEIYRQLLGDRTPLVPSGVRHLIDVLGKHQVPVAVACSAPEARVQPVLEATGLAPALEAVVTAEDVYRGRPDPEAYLLAAQRLQRPPVRCVVIGNSNQSVEAARECGMACVVVAGRNPLYELTAADLVVRQLEELSLVNLKQLFQLEDRVDPREGGELEMEEEPEPAPYAKTLTMDRPW